MNLKETYNKISKDWSKDHSNDTWWQEGTDHLLSLLPKGASIHDVGCGAGIKSHYLASKGFEVTGTDFSEGMIATAQAQFPDITFKVLDVYDFDTLTDKFDCIFAQAMLLHIPKARVMEVLEKFKNNLKPDGLLYIGVKEIKEDQQEEKIIKENDYGYEYERFFSFYNMPELEGYFKKLGLEILWENRTSSGRTNWLQIIGKKI